MITLVPVGGLANRMRAIVSGIALSDESGQALKIVWLQDKGLNCRFDELFCPLCHPNVQLEEETVWNKMAFDYPRKSNLYFPSLIQRIYFNGRMYEKNSVLGACDYAAWIQKHSRSYIATFSPFFPADSDLWRGLFQPVPALNERIEKNCSHFSPHTVGVHIRRSDNVRSIQESPIDLFIELMDKEVSQQADTSFFVCSDSEKTKEALKAYFGDRIISSEETGERDSKDGMFGAVVDLYSLSKCSKIIGSYYSSFSEISAQTSGVPLTIARRMTQ